MVCSLLCVGWVFLFPISRHFLQGEKTPFHEGFLGMVSQQPEAPNKYWLNQVKENYEYMYVNIYRQIHHMPRYGRSPYIWLVLCGSK